MRRAVSMLVIMAFVIASSQAAHADDDPQVSAARDEFVRGTDFVHKSQWAEALAAFERSAKLKPHAITTYNIGYCERALGRYTRAKETLEAALKENDASGGAQLAPGLVTDTQGYLDQIKSLLSVADIKLEPAEAAITVDGRPLLAGADGTLIAGIRAPGPGEAAPSGAFRVVLDPGPHVLTLSRKGYADAVVNKTFAPGATVPVALALDKLPATFHVEADQASAVVRFAGADVGFAPVDVSRPGGSYKVEVVKSGFVTYESTVVGQPGEAVNLRAPLRRESPSLVTRWWFWTAAVAVVAGAATATYFIVQANQTPTQPPPNGGGLGWTVQIP